MRRCRANTRWDGLAAARAADVRRACRRVARPSGGAVAAADAADLQPPTLSYSSSGNWQPNTSLKCRPSVAMRAWFSPSSKSSRFRRIRPRCSPASAPTSSIARPDAAMLVDDDGLVVWPGTELSLQALGFRDEPPGTRPRCRVRACSAAGHQQSRMPMMLSPSYREPRMRGFDRWPPGREWAA